MDSETLFKFAQLPVSIQWKCEECIIKPKETVQNNSGKSPCKKKLNVAKEKLQRPTLTLYPELAKRIVFLIDKIENIWVLCDEEKH